MKVISLEEGAKRIKKGEVVVFPTETAFGIGADALNKEAVRKVYALKKREKSKKLPVIINSVGQLKGVNELGVYLSSKLHPGPINIVTKEKQPWIGAFRISSSPLASRLARLSRTPITATSANLSGARPAFKKREIKVDAPVIKCPDLKEGEVSTVFDPFTRKIIRKGAVAENEIMRHVFAFDALNKVKPSAEEAKKVIDKADRALKIVQKLHPESIVGGSVAKRTFLRNSGDIDIFLLFPKDEKLEEKIDLLEKIAVKVGGKAEKTYAQHPYVRTEFEGTVVEIVPAYDTPPSEIISATDRSQWHVKFVEKFPEALKDEVRIIKAFFKGITVYGADTKVEGFSAYATEVLAQKRGGFVKFLESVEKMSWPISQSDPVDPKRNVLASVSEEKFNLLKEAARKYLEKPSLKFFFPEKPAAPESLPPGNLVLVKMPLPELPADAVWGWAKGKARKISRNSELQGYVCEKFGVFAGPEVFILMKFNKLKQDVVEIRGPPVDHKNARGFKAVHSGWYEKGNILYASEKSRFPTIDSMIKYIEPCEIIYGNDLRAFYKKLKAKEKAEVCGMLSSRKPWE
jgi:tRNA nucleotidyltransferase (CCA-adding enzyme)